jgi:hypothetical protein
LCPSFFKESDRLRVIDWEGIAGDEEIAGPELIERNVVIEDDVGGFPSGKDRFLIGFDDVFEIDFDGESEGVPVAFISRMMRRRKRLLGLPSMKSLMTLRGSRSFQERRIEGIDAFDDDHVVVFPIEDRRIRDPFGDQFRIAFSLGLAIFGESLDILGRFGEGVDAGLIEVEENPFAFEPGAMNAPNPRAKRGLGSCESSRGRSLVFLFEGEIDDDVLMRFSISGRFCREF